MGIFDRVRGRLPRARGRRGGGRGATGTLRTSDSADERHLKEWVVARRGIEGFVEPRTTVSDVTLLLVAHDGEWTRRRVASVEWAHEFCNRHQVPSYDAAVVGIPARMREYNRRRKQQGGAAGA